MRGFLLDANIPSEFRNSRPDLRVAQCLDSIDESLIFIGVVTPGDLRKDWELLTAGKRRAELEHCLDLRELQL